MRSGSNGERWSVIRVLAGDFEVIERASDLVSNVFNADGVPPRRIGLDRGALKRLLLIQLSLSRFQPRGDYLAAAIDDKASR